jgi:hypothetical protein
MKPNTGKGPVGVPNQKRMKPETYSILDLPEAEPVPEVSGAELRQAPGMPIKSVFAKLSETLGGLAANLRGDDAHREESLRSTLVKGLGQYAGDHLKMGRLLDEYKSVYKSKRQWTEVAKQIGAAMSRSERTIFRMIDDYRASLAQAPEPSPEIDRTEINGAVLSKQEHAEIRARLAIRGLLDDTPVNKKADLLAKVLAEEVHQIWGKTAEIQIRIIPIESRYTIDGRKKAAPKSAQEAAA